MKYTLAVEVTALLVVAVAAGCCGPCVAVTRLGARSWVSESRPRQPRQRLVRPRPGWPALPPLAWSAVAQYGKRW